MSHFTIRDGGASAAPACQPQNVTTDNWGLRIGSIFVILVTSMIGALVPIYLARASRMSVPKHLFFIAKYFGSGVILATAWMHLLSSAEQELGHSCLVPIMGTYDWAMAIAMMTVMVMFLVELVVARFGFGFVHSHGPDDDGDSAHHSDDSAGSVRNERVVEQPHTKQATDLEAAVLRDGGPKETSNSSSPALTVDKNASRIPGLPDDLSYPPGGQDHLGHQREHFEGDSHAAYAAQMTSLFILEFGVVFHSVFIGLTLAVSGEFVILFIVIVFHQCFEGLGLGSRLATAKWPAGPRRWTPWVMGGLYACTTPISIAIGLGVKQGLAADPSKSLVVNGVFDAISAGILIYTALVELLAHEFMFNPEMRNAPMSMQLYAYACVACGCGLMALLAKWA